MGYYDKVGIGNGFGEYLTEKRLDLIKSDDENDVSDTAEFIKCYLNPIYKAVKGKGDGLEQIEAIRKVLKRRVKCSLDVTSYENEEGDGAGQDCNEIVIYTYDGEDSARIFVKEITPICEKIADELNGITVKVSPGIYHGGKVIFKWKDSDFGGEVVDSLLEEIKDALESVADAGSYDNRIVKRSAKCFENYKAIPFVQDYNDKRVTFVDGSRHRTNYVPDDAFPTLGAPQGFGYFIVGKYDTRDKDALRSGLKDLPYGSLKDLLMGSHSNGNIYVFKYNGYKIDGKDCMIVLAANGG